MPAYKDGAQAAHRSLLQLVCGIVLLVLVVALAVLRVRTHALNPIDNWAARRVGDHWGSTPFLSIADLGNPLVVGAVAVAGAGVSLARRQVARALACLLGPGLAGLLTEFVFKPIVDAHRAGVSFPSGHTTGTAALVSVIVLASPRGRRLLVALGLGLLVASCVAVVALEWHTAVEALAGTFVGCGTVLLVTGLLRADPRPVIRPAKGTRSG